MNEIINEQNKRDLKLYRLIIGAAILASAMIGIIVLISTGDVFTMEAKATNGFLTLIMPKQIEAIDQTGDGQYTNGMVFYREKNEDYNPKEDEPINAFNYYHLSPEGKKIYLKNGVYYPPEYYMKDRKEEVAPAQVYLGFYLKAMDNIKTIKNIVSVVVTLVILALIAFGIYLWYLSWRKREEAKRQNRRNY